MKWWGWGEPARATDRAPHALDFAARPSSACPERRRRPWGSRTSRCPRPDCPKQAGARSTGGRRGVGPQGPPDACHARGRQGLSRTSSACAAGDASPAPDAVVYPGGRGRGARGAGRLRVASGWRWCRSAAARASSAGSSRVRDGVAAVISLDLGAHGEPRGVDERSLTADLGPGLRGPQVEAALGAHGLTLGHFPQSFEYATVGGWVATRSAGQASTGYGSIEKLVCGLRCVTPAARSTCRRCPRPPPGRAAPAPGRLGGRARRDHPGDPEGPPAPRGAPLRGLDVPRLRGRAWRRSARSSRAASCPTWRGSRTRRRPALSLALAGGDSLQRRAGRRLHAGARLRRRLHRRARLRGRACRRRAARRARRDGCCGGPAAWRSARLPGGPGSTGATRGPTCAMRCWSTA